MANLAGDVCGSGTELTGRATACLHRLGPAIQDSVGCRIASLAAGAAERRQRGEQVERPERGSHGGCRHLGGSAHFGTKFVAQALQADVGDHAGVQDRAGVQYPLQSPLRAFEPRRGVLEIDRRSYSDSRTSDCSKCEASSVKGHQA